MVFVNCGDECFCTDLFLEGSVEGSTEELALLDAINSYRRDEGLTGLTPSSSLFAAAHNQAFDLQENQLPLSHEGSEGSSVSDRVRAAGYTSPECASENAHGQWSCGFVGVSCVLSAWQDSRGHDDNLLDEGAHAIGLGIHGGVSVAVLAAPS